MNRIKKASLLIAAVFLGSTLLFSAAAPSVSAINVLDKACGTAGGGNAVCDSKGDDLNVTMKKIINMLLYIVGIVSVISIIIGGILYTTSTGDQGKIQTAKNTILYSVVGLVVAILAFAIVNFVVTNIG